MARHQIGPGLIVDENEKVVVVPAGDGLGPGHGPAHTFTMTMMDPRHPITAGMPKQWKHPTAQLTHGQHAPAHPRQGAIENELRILTYAASKDSHRREPMDWLRTWGTGRIYVTMLGHTWRNRKIPTAAAPDSRRFLPEAWNGPCRVRSPSRCRRSFLPPRTWSTVPEA